MFYRDLSTTPPGAGPAGHDCLEKGIAAGGAAQSHQAPDTRELSSPARRVARPGSCHHGQTSRRQEQQPATGSQPVSALAAATELMRNGLTAVLVGLVRGYQRLVSPLLGPRCRYYPSCSAYTITALQTHGPWQGCWLALRRVTRCHPGCEGGHDPVPSCRQPTH